MYRVDLFWCCLHPAEKLVMQACLFQFTTFTGYITKANYDLAWLATGSANVLPRIKAYEQVYGLQEGVIVDIEGNPTEVYYFIGNFWGELFAYYERTFLVCAKPCRELTYSDVT